MSFFVITPRGRGGPVRSPSSLGSAVHPPRVRLFVFEKRQTTPFTNRPQKYTFQCIGSELNCTISFSSGCNRKPWLKTSKPSFVKHGLRPHDVFPTPPFSRLSRGHSTLKQPVQLRSFPFARLLSHLIVRASTTHFFLSG